MGFEPSQAESSYSSESTLYIVSYDIPNDRRRTRIHSALTGFGIWVQFSVFECFLDRKQRIQLEARLLEEMHQQEDTIRIYGLCAACQTKVEVLGGGDAPMKIMSTCYSDNFCEARSAVNPKQDASQISLNVAKRFPGRCKTSHLWVYYHHSLRKPIQKMANHVCLAKQAIAPLQKRREAPAVARAEGSQLRLKPFERCTGSNV